MISVDHNGGDHGIVIEIDQARIRLHYHDLPIFGSGYLFLTNWYWLPVYYIWAQVIGHR
jgi:hypothetical protein